jgi:hypothetical protein
MLEGGRSVEHPNYPTAMLEPWKLPDHGKLTQEDRKRGHIQTRHYVYQADTRDFFINDRENPYTELKRFDWIRGDIVGGRSLL